MIVGYQRLKNCEPGQLVRFESGTYALLSEYFTGHPTIPDAYIAGSGENLCSNNPEEWVAIISLDEIEANVADERLDYPK